MPKETQFQKSLDELQKIADWFGEQEQINIEEGLTKVREGAALVKQLKTRLAEVENEFVEIQKDLED
jgi:exodeoxyribonuclease VII small subunit